MQRMQPVHAIDDVQVARGAEATQHAMGDAAGMARAIAETLDSPPAKDMLLERARDFSYDKAISGYEDVLTTP